MRWKLIFFFIGLAAVFGAGSGLAGGISMDTVKVTRDFVCDGEISPFQYGQFVEYLCDLVPSMWAEKLYDGSFEGLSPYNVAFRKEMDFREKPWYPSGAESGKVYARS